MQEKGWNFRQSVFLRAGLVERCGCGENKVCSSVRTHLPPFKLRLPHALYTLVGCASVQVQ